MSLAGLCGDLPVDDVEAAHRWINFVEEPGGHIAAIGAPEENGTRRTRHEGRGWLSAGTYLAAHSGRKRSRMAGSSSPRLNCPSHRRR